MDPLRRKMMMGASLALATAGLAACGGEGSPSEPSPQPDDNGPSGASVDSVAVTGAPESLAVGSSQQLTATATYSDQSTADVSASATWASSDEAVATVSAAGLLTAVATGTAKITATVDGIASEEITVSITAAWASIAFAPLDAAIEVGATVTLTLMGTATDGSGGRVKGGITWSSSDDTILTADGAGQATGIASGSATVTAKVAGVSDATLEVAVTAPAVATGGLLSPRSGGGCVMLGATVLLFGGQTTGNVALNTVERYDPASGTSTALNPMPAAMTSLQWVKLDDGRLLVVDGPTGLCYTYAPQLDEWTTLGAIAQRPVGYGSSLVKLRDGKVLMTGTDRQNGPLALFDPASNTWSNRANCTPAQNGPSSVLLDDGRVLVLGGQVLDGSPLGPDGYAPFTANCHIYDPVADSWAAVAPLSVARSVFFMEKLSDGKVLAAGGIIGKNNYVSVTEVYDPATNTWTVVAPLTDTRRGGRLVKRADGECILMGGGAPTTANVERFAMTSWVAEPAMAAPRGSFHALPLSSGKVMILGGRDSAGTILNTVELY